MSSEKNDCTICDKIGLKPFTKENVYFYYLPLHGLASYTALSVNIMNPKLMSEILPKKDITNVLLLSSVVGTAFYIYGRPHLKSIPNSKRRCYAVLGSSLFCMGSVLAWAVLKSMLPCKNSILATAVGLGSGALVVKLSKDYFAETDKLVK